MDYDKEHGASDATKFFYADQRCKPEKVTDMGAKIMDITQP